MGLKPEDLFKSPLFWTAVYVAIFTVPAMVIGAAAEVCYWTGFYVECRIR